MVENLKRGDKVVTSGGIVGTVERIIDNDKVEVQIAENINVEVVRALTTSTLIFSAICTSTLSLSIILSTVPTIPPEVTTLSPLFKFSTIALCSLTFFC